MWNLFIIDDHPLVVDGIKTMLQGIDFIIVKKAARTGKEALNILSEESNIDLILLDLNLPDMDGISLCEMIRKQNKKVKILGLSYVNEAGITAQLLKMGAQGFVLKSMDREELLRAIEQVMAGKTYLSADANSKILDELRKNAGADSLPLLTRRENEILTLLTEGLKSAEIAEKLFLSAHTVDTHRKNMLQKFNVHNTQSLINRIRELGLLNK